MSIEEKHILDYFDKPNYKVLKTFHREEAWNYILQIRYGLSCRARVKRAFKNYDKTNALLVIFIILKDNKPFQIGSNYYLDKRDKTSTEEGDVNMFDVLPYELVDVPDAPKIIKKIIKESISEAKIDTN